MIFYDLALIVEKISCIVSDYLFPRKYYTLKEVLRRGGTYHYGGIHLYLSSTFQYADVKFSPGIERDELCARWIEARDNNLRVWEK